MKTQISISIATFFFFAATICSAQALFTGNVQIANLSQARGIAACSDGGSGVVGDVYTSSSSSVFLTKLNSSGFQEWSVNVSKGGNQFPIAKAGVIALTDSGFLVSTIQNNTDSLFILRISKSGVVQWCKTVGYAREVCMIQASDGGFLIVAANGNLNPDRLEVHKLDYLGVSQWDKEYETSFGTLLKPATLLQNINGDYTITSEYSDGAIQSQIRVIRIQSNGTLLWANKYWVSGFPMVFGGYKMKELSNGNLNLLFEAQTLGLGLKSRVAKLALTSAGTLTGNTDGYVLADTGMHVSSALFTADGGFAFAGYTLQSTASDSWVLKFDSQENFQWGKVFPIALTSEYTNQLVETSTALCFSAWQIGGGAPSSAQISKISFSGQSACASTPFSVIDSGYIPMQAFDSIFTYTAMSSYSTSYTTLPGTTSSIVCTTGIEDNETVQNDFAIYADPSGDYILVYPGHLRDSEVIFEIYEMRGRLVEDMNKMRTTNDQQIKINVSQLSRGIYILTARSATGVVSRKFLK